MRKRIRGFVFLLVALAVLFIGLVYMASTSDGYDKLQNAVNRITGDKYHIDLSEFGKWSSNVKNEAMEGLPETEAFFHVDDDSSLQFFESYPIYEEDIQMEFKSKKIQSIHMIIGACELRQQTSPDKLIHVSSSEVGKIQCFLLNHTLYIIAGQKVKKGVNFTEGRITLELPENISFESLQVELGAGTIGFDRMNAATTAFDVGAGSIRIEKLNSDNADFKVGMGRMEVTDAFVKKALVDVGVGEFIYAGAFKKSADLKCAMGRVKATLPGVEQDYNYTLECSVGKISIADTEYTGISTTKKIDNASKKNIGLECSVGSIEIEFKE